MSGENCAATVSGTIDDGGGQTVVSIACAALSKTGGADVSVDLTVRANDLRTPDQVCGD